MGQKAVPLLHRVLVGTALAVAACSGQKPPATSVGPAPATSPSASVESSSYVRALKDKLGDQRLTLEPALQDATEAAIRGTDRAAAMVAVVPSTGKVLALFSRPGERGDPLLTAHMPASTFKAFAAFAGLEAGKLTATTVKECTGHFAFAGKEFRCASVHGKETTAQAIALSCNSFFYEMATEVDHGVVLDVARRVGFGRKTNIELPEETGVVEDHDRQMEIARDPESTVPLLDAIGHGEITVTLLQLARAFAAISTGKLVSFHVTEAGLLDDAPNAKPVALRAQDLALVRAALVDAVAAPQGTAHELFRPDLAIAAKTGSAEAPPREGSSGEEEERWFVAYAPASEPSILVAARVERVRTPDDAKVLVRQVLDRAFAK